MDEEPEIPKSDLQDPLPESSWFWRRFFTFAVVAVTMGFLAVTLHALGHVAEMDPRRGISALLEIANNLLWFCFALVTYYLIAPSAEQIVKMIHTAALLRSGVQIASRSVQQDGRRETAQTTGRPPQPQAPSIPDRRRPTQGGSGRRLNEDDDVAPRSRR